MTQAEAKALAKQHGSMSAAARAVGMAKTTFHDLCVSGRQPRAPKANALATSTANTPACGRTLADFRNTYDKATIIPAKVKAALRALGSGGWDYEVAFAKAAGVSLADLATVRDAFAAHIVTIGRESRRAWAGSAATAEAMRRML